MDATPVMVRVPPAELVEIDAWMKKQAGPLSRPEALRVLAKLGLAADRQRREAAKTSAADARKADSAQARIEYEAARNAEHVKTERLRQVRLAKEEHERRKAAEGPSPGDRQSATRHAAARAKELAIGAVKAKLADVDASDDVKLERKHKLVAPPATDKIRKPK